MLSMTEAAPFANSFERAFLGMDDRVEVDATAPPWNMTGNLDRSLIEGNGRYRIIGVENNTDAQLREAYDRNVAVYVDSIMAEMWALATGDTGAPPQPEK